MKRFTLITLIALVLTSSAPAFAQQRNFTKTLGDKHVSSITISETRKGDKIIARLTEGTHIEIHTMDSQRNTISFQVMDSAKDTDASVTLSDGIYTFEGKVKGKNISRTEKSAGHPWYQNPEINGLQLFKGKQNFKYDGIRPDNLERATLKSSDKGIQTIDGMKVIQLLNTNTGAFAGMWTCSYCFDAETGEFVLYKSVEGAPGTPETKIRIKR